MTVVLVGAAASEASEDTDVNDEEAGVSCGPRLLVTVLRNDPEALA